MIAEHQVQINFFLYRFSIERKHYLLLKLFFHSIVLKKDLQPFPIIDGNLGILCILYNVALGNNAAANVIIIITSISFLAQPFKKWNAVFVKF